MPPARKRGSRSFRQAERECQVRFKTTSPSFSDEARSEPGTFRGHAYPFCLPVNRAEENLFPGIRHAAKAYFAAHRIKWHHGWNHMLSSQVQCVNCLFPLASSPSMVAALFRPLFPQIQDIVPLEGDPQQLISFEWADPENLLGEWGHGARGAFSTAPDAAFMFKRRDGKKQIVLIEWKYTESYTATSLARSDSGARRLKTYKKLFRREDCPINKQKLPSYEALFYEPFYQLFREQLLAHEMERTCAMGASVVTLVHLAPAGNTTLERVTSPELARLGDSVTEVWRKLLRKPNRFIGAKLEDLFARFPAQRYPKLRGWRKYMGSRYPWLFGSN